MITEQHMPVRPGSKPGEFRGEGPGPFLIRRVDRLCPMCGRQMFVFEGFTERVIIKHLCTKHEGCAIVEDIPTGFAIIGCKECKCNFTEPS